MIPLICCREDPDDIIGLTRKDIQRWYIEEHSAEFEDQEEAQSTADVVRRIIHRLIAKVLVRKLMIVFILRLKSIILLCFCRSLYISLQVSVQCGLCVCHG